MCAFLMLLLTFDGQSLSLLRAPASNNLPGQPIQPAMSDELADENDTDSDSDTVSPVQVVRQSPNRRKVAQAKGEKSKRRLIIPLLP